MFISVALYLLYNILNYNNIVLVFVQYKYCQSHNNMLYKNTENTQ